MSNEQALNYNNYLKVDELLALQQPLSDGPEHDELLFIIIHQTYELWFKELIHEFAASQLALEAGDTHRALSILGRIRTILKICVAQIDILETMTPLQFNSFRSRLGESSGFQSAQFREVEAILGRRDKRAAAHLLPEDKVRVERWMASRSLWDCVLHYVVKRGYKIPDSVMNRDVTNAYEPNPDVQEALIELHRRDPEAGLVFERLVDIDEGLQEWRYRHVKMVERTIGRKSGTGGSAGADYLRQTLFTPTFPDLWEIRNRF
ncbi:MAG: tryptophan 2,3-dioxygenase [Candidatus Nanopelagicaceae bacterium]|nr:tryptophan 2,3-dioxygenase [Candidatus Nanopelagicaceae bacterium]